MKKVYICIDLKSFYASVECVERGLDPLHTNLVVADSSRTEKTICLAVSPSLKKYDIPGRARLFEVVQRVKNINLERKANYQNRKFTHKSYLEEELDKDPSLELDFIIATPRMKLYMDYSSRIFDIYLKYIAPEDIFSYSIDEVFCDVTGYLKNYKMTPKELITKMIQDVYFETGITATGGIGSNMYLAKIAMDIVAKHMEANSFGVRIAELDEMSYRKLLWNHRPLTAFWRIGKGISKKLEDHHMFTMGDVARKSLEDEELLYRLFGINAEFLIDHAWGWEPCGMKDVKSYRPKIHSLSSGQVLSRPYPYHQARLVLKEMTDALVLDLVSKRLKTNQIVLDIGYDVYNASFYEGEFSVDYYGRKVPKHAHGTIRIDTMTSSYEEILEKVLELYESIINSDLYVRRINLTFGNVCFKNKISYQQLSIFDKEPIPEKDDLCELELQKTLLQIKNKYGRNAILKGMNLEKGGTMIERNKQVGGHRA